jgi:cytochrome P450
MTRPPRLRPTPALIRAVWGRRSLPFFLLRAAKQHGDALELRGWRHPIWFVSHPDLVQQVLVANPTKWSKARGVEKTKKMLGEGVLGSSGELHRARRRLLQPLFAAARLPLYADTIVESALETRANWRDGQTLDMSAEMSHLALVIVTRSVFGSCAAGESAKVARALDEAMRLFNGSMTPLGDLFERLPSVKARLAKARAELDGVVFDLLAQKRSEGASGEDVISVLLRARDENGDVLPDEGIRDEAMTLLLAGHETTANALAFAWSFLSRHPRERAEVEREIRCVLNGRRATFADLEQLQWTRAVLSETMRLLPPAWMVARRALEPIDIEFQGDTFQVPRGATVLVSSFVLHRDPRFWNEPNRFNPARWLEPGFAPHKWTFIPFGAGYRSCLAENFAWMEATLGLATLAQEFRAASTSRLELDPSVTLRPRGPLWMKLEHHG